MRTTVLFAAWIGLLLLASCGRYIYKSVTPHNNLFTKQHDANLQLNLGGSGGDIYLGYAPLNFLSIGAAYSGYSNLDSLDNKVGTFRDYEFSLSPFYAKDELVLEMPLGVGTTSKTTKTPILQITSPYIRYFAQPTIGFKWDAVEMAVFCRISGLDFSDRRYGTDMRYEPGFMFRGGTKHIQAMIQMRGDFGTNYSKRPSTPLSIYEQAEYFPFHLSMGLSFAINGADFKKKPKPQP